MFAGDKAACVFSATVLCLVWVEEDLFLYILDQRVSKSEIPLLLCWCGSTESQNLEQPGEDPWGIDSQSHEKEKKLQSE